MQHHFFKAIKFFFITIVLGCHDTNLGHDSVSPQSPPWSFALQMDALYLNDAAGKTGLELSSEVLGRIKNPSFFSDSGESRFYSTSTNPRINGNFFVYSKDMIATEYRWSKSFEKNSHNSWATCSTRVADTLQFVDCERKRVLDCLERKARQYRYDNTMESLSTEESSLLVRWLRSCDLDPQFANVFDGHISFRVEREVLSFSPSPLSSLLIFKGSWANYEEAQIQAIAAASLPQVSDCSRADASCWASPVPLSQCRGCAELEKGKIHTVFFFEGLRQDYSNIKSVLFVPE